ncbi:MAG: CocE/NonD family hydrolase, partial [Desulfobacterales bacterium]|nr:CocE/NonD family hydrolase [Desulfobacterales bacterium]
RQQTHRKDPKPHEYLLMDHSVEVCDIDFMVTRGYAFVIPDPRGVGKSEGEWNGMYSPQEQKDVYDVIEWVAEQPWCDGNVGMIGMSYFGFIQPLAAAQQPPHLKAIMPIGVCESLYNRAYPGGMLNDFYMCFYLINNPNNAVSESERVYSEEELKRRVKEAEQDPFVASNTYYIKILETWPPRYNTWFYDVLLHPLDGPFWQTRSEQNKREKIKIPVYLATTDYLHYQIFNSYSDPKLDVPKKALAMGRDLPCPYRYSTEETLRWYDHWLKGVDTGIMDEPPIKIFVHGANRYRFENEWPLERTEWTRFYLQKFKKLDTARQRDAEGQPDIFFHDPNRPYTPSRIPLEPESSLKYSSEPLTKPVEVTGPIALSLYAAIDVADANFIAKLSDVARDGKKVVSVGHLKASHRALLDSESTPWRPVHDHTKAVPIKPGEINEYAIEMAAGSHVFQSGHRIELEIKSMDPAPAPYTGGTSILCIPSPWVTTYKIYHEEDYPSHIMLPVIPETPPDLWLD